ncbi:MAG TPA: aminotransferase class V-fold PLP-dependent enzyme [Vicinamibacterales bacterium]|nr:aminotransferase class V-fold PLP-dependent enzyme [Vicinamibacterales bacterium]
MPTFGRVMRAHWPLDPGVTYLNHGTVGVTPIRVLAAQQAIRDEIERQPSAFMLREMSNWVGGPRDRPTRIRAAADIVARFIGARGPDVVFVDNATAGANAVLRSFHLAPGDEILATDFGYGAVTNAARFAARERGATVRVVTLPYPDYDEARAVETVERAIGSATKLAVVDHVAAETAIVLPLAEIAARCQARGVPVLADGAHAPGQIALDVPSLGVDWYTGNLHKWAHAPRSSGLLWAHPDRQASLHPPVISWGLDQGFTAEFDWVGTRDPSPWLAAPAGIAFLEEMGFDEIRRYCHGLAWRSAHRLAAAWGTDFTIPESAVGSMATVPLPASLGSTPEAARTLRDHLLFDDYIEVQLHASHGRLWVRISAQIYNDNDDVQRLEQAVLGVKGA